MRAPFETLDTNFVNAAVAFTFIALARMVMPMTVFANWITVVDLVVPLNVSIFGVTALPFVRPVNVHEVVVLVHDFPFSANVTTYEYSVVAVVAGTHDTFSSAFPAVKLADTGTSGGAAVVVVAIVVVVDVVVVVSGTAVTVTGFAPAGSDGIDATTPTTYSPVTTGPAPTNETVSGWLSPAPFWAFTDTLYVVPFVMPPVAVHDNVGATYVHAPTPADGVMVIA